VGKRGEVWESWGGRRKMGGSKHHRLEGRRHEVQIYKASHFLIEEGGSSLKQERDGKEVAE